MEGGCEKAVGGGNGRKLKSARSGSRKLLWVEDCGSWKAAECGSGKLLESCWR